MACVKGSRNGIIQTIKKAPLETKLFWGLFRSDTFTLYHYPITPPNFPCESEKKALKMYEPKPRTAPFRATFRIAPQSAENTLKSGVCSASSTGSPKPEITAITRPFTRSDFAIVNNLLFTFSIILFITC